MCLDTKRPLSHRTRRCTLTLVHAAVASSMPFHLTSLTCAVRLRFSSGTRNAARGGRHAARQHACTCAGGRRCAGAHESFGGRTFSYFTSLKLPVMDSNVFFRPTAAPVVAVATDDDHLIGVAQLLRVTLRPIAGGDDSRSVAFVQSVAVAPSARPRAACGGSRG